MKNEDSIKSSKNSLLPLIDNLEEILKIQDEFAEKASLEKIKSLIHQINELSLKAGITNLANLIEPIDLFLIELVENKGKLTKNKSIIILSSLSIANAILDDPTLSMAGLRTNYDSMKKQVNENFIVKKVETDDNLFSNNKFQEIFIEEANDLINQLEEKLLQLECEPTDLNLIDTVFRIMHTLKGNSNMFGYKHLGEITHHLENIYDAIRSHKLDVNRTILDITLLCIDHFRNLIEDQDLSIDSNKSMQEGILNDIVEILDAGDKAIELEKEGQHEIAGPKSLYIFFKPTSNIFDDGSNPLFFIADLHELGECLVISVMSDLPTDASFDPHKCYTCWHVLIATNETMDAVAENFMFLHETSQPEIVFVGKENILKNEKLVNDFKVEAKNSKSLSAWLVEKTGHGQKYEDKKVTSNHVADSSITSIRVASSKIDLMMNLISELVTKQAELSMVAGNNEIPQLQALAESIESISRDLRDNAFSISLIPIDKTVLRFQRLVRDVSAKFGKKVNFVVEGKETELDKTIIEKIVDPIMHILRNSIDHGIETPEQRKILGKPEEGTITLRAFPSGAHVVIEISDDGSGINIERVKQVAIRKGYINSTDEFTTNDMLKLILTPGFSTVDNVSEVSGRGVGMDVVNQKLSEIRGELEIETEAKVGTTMTIKLPLTISIIDSLLVMTGSTFYLIPLSVVERCAEIQTSVITELTTNYLNLSGVFIPFIDLHKEFEIPEERLSYQRLIIVNHKNTQVALVVDQILGNYQAVLKPLGQAYKKQEIISGASILGNGEVALVLDTNKIVQEYMSMRDNEIETISSLNMQIS